MLVLQITLFTIACCFVLMLFVFVRTYIESREQDAEEIYRNQTKGEQDETK